MKILLYSPQYEHFWVGCSREEAERELLPHMEKEQILEYLRITGNDDSDNRGGSYVDTVTHIYGINEVPEVFAVITRDMKVRVVDDPLYPFSALVPDSVFHECDHIEIGSIGQLKRLCMTHDGGEPFNGQPARRRLYFDMDGTLVDFRSGMDRVNPNILAQYEDHPDDIEGIFSLMDPMPGAVESVYQLADLYDCYILSTAPWDNPGAWADKVRWIRQHMGDIFYKKVILAHSKNLLNDGESLLVDDRTAHGADAFGENLIEFHGNWSETTVRLREIAVSEGAGIRYHRH